MSFILLALIVFSGIVGAISALRTDRSEAGEGVEADSFIIEEQ